MGGSHCSGETRHWGSWSSAARCHVCCGGVRPQPQGEPQGAQALDSGSTHCALQGLQPSVGSATASLVAVPGGVGVAMFSST